MKAVFFVHQPGYDMLAGMDLHAQIAGREVQLTVNGLPYGQSFTDVMADHTVSLLHVKHQCAAKRASVGTLTALLGEKRGLIKHDGKAFPVSIARENRRVKALHVAVNIK